MTRDEAIKNITTWMYATSDLPPKQVAEALDLAIAALRHQIWEEQVWHDAKTDPPKTPGLYYGKKDDTNSMYACRYRDSVWVLDMYPQQQMDIVQWADYAAFVRQDEDTALRSVSREQVERMSGEWVHEPNKRSSLFYCSSCGESFNIHSYEAEKYGFCPYCGIPVTDKAVLVIERWEALKDGSTTD